MTASTLVGLLFAVSYVLVVFVVQPLLLRRRTGRSAWLPSLGANRGSGPPTDVNSPRRPYRGHRDQRSSGGRLGWRGSR